MVVVVVGRQWGPIFRNWPTMAQFWVLSGTAGSSGWGRWWDFGDTVMVAVGWCVCKCKAGICRLKTQNQADAAWFWICHLKGRWYIVKGGIPNQSGGSHAHCVHLPGVPIPFQLLYSLPTLIIPPPLAPNPPTPNPCFSHCHCHCCTYAWWPSWCNCCFSHCHCCCWMCACHPAATDAASVSAVHMCTLSLALSLCVPTLHSSVFC